MGKLINIGYGNLVNADSVISVVNPDSAPIKRFIQSARDKGTVVDVTQGRKTQSVIVTSCDYIILSALLPETIGGRLNSERSGSERFFAERTDMEAEQDEGCAEGETEE